MSKRKVSENVLSLKKMHVQQLQHRNQFLIENNDVAIFQSYDSVVAVYDKNTSELLLGCDFDYSVTTLKHLYWFIAWFTERDDIKDVVFNASNKKQAIIKLIKQGVISYDYLLK